jgi:fatty-acyl-CoA synthase
MVDAPPSDVFQDDVFLDPLTPVVFLERTLRVFPGRVAVRYGAERLDYAQFAERVGQMAGALQRAGIREGDRVAVLSPNTPWHLAAHFALPLLRAPLVSINTRLAPREIAYILEHSGARLLLVDPELAAPLDGVLGGIRSLETVVELPDPAAPVRAGRTAYTDWARGAAALPIRSELVDENAVLSINYTSGTTGMPKGVMYTHRGAYLNALGQLGALRLSKDTVFLWTLPMFHCNGWCMPWAVTAAGGCHVALRRIDPPEVLQLIETHGVTHFNGAPTVLLMLSSHPAAAGRRFEPRVQVATGGAPPSPTLLEAMEKLGVRITHLYGLTETYGPHVLCEMQSEWEALDAAARARVMSRQGVPYVHSIHLRVVDDEMRDVPADATTMGEVVMRGNNVMRGYYDDPEATAKAFRGGWFHSGDVGVMHADGYIELRDRSKDIIISGGENISTIEVENLLYQHPDVQEVAVVGVPDERWGEVPKAFVTLRPGRSPRAEDLIAFARERIAHFKCPKAVEFCELPKTATGKIQKFKLREKEWTGKERRIQG